jgi:formyl-CoA transferase
VIGILAGVSAKGRGRNAPKQVDVALYESIFSLLEGALPEYSLLDVVRQPTGSGLPTAAPSNTYRTRDDDWIIIAANSEPILHRLAHLIGRPDILSDPRFTSNDRRVANAKALDAIITEWTMTQTAAEAEAALEAADVPSCKIYTIADCARDPHFRSRGMIRPVNDPGLGEPLHPGVVPKFAGASEIAIKPGPALGAHTDEVLAGVVGLDRDAIATLRGAGVIA